MHFTNLRDLEEIGVSHNHNIRKKVFIEPNTLQNLIYFNAPCSHQVKQHKPTITAIWRKFFMSHQAVRRSL